MYHIEYIEENVQKNGGTFEKRGSKDTQDLVNANPDFMVAFNIQSNHKT